MIVSKGTSSVETTTFGLLDFVSRTSSIGAGFAGVSSSLVPIAIIFLVGCFVIEVLITLLVALPSTVVTSLNTICSPLTPSWTTLVCPLGKVASGCSIVSKGIASVVDLSSGLFTTTDLIPSSGVVLYSSFVVGCTGCVDSIVDCSSFGRTFCSCCGKTFKSLCVKYPTYRYPSILITPLASSVELVTVVWVLCWTNSLFSKANVWNGMMTLCPIAPIKTTLRTLFLCFLDISRTTNTAVPIPKPVTGRELWPVLGSSLISVGLSVGLVVWVSFL